MNVSTRVDQIHQLLFTHLSLINITEDSIC